MLSGPSPEDFISNRHSRVVKLSIPFPDLEKYKFRGVLISNSDY